jgi:hypothetical protein
MATKTHLAFIGVGVLGIAIGTAIILTSADIIPVQMQRGPGVANWIVICAGIAFAAFGGIFALTGFSETTLGRRARKRTPRLFQLLNLVVMVVSLGSLAIIASFAAVGPGPRSFSFNLPLIGNMVGAETLGRIFFGAVALILWGLVGALAWFGLLGIAGKDADEAPRGRDR